MSGPAALLLSVDGPVIGRSASGSGSTSAATACDPKITAPTSPTVPVPAARLFSALAAAISQSSTRGVAPSGASPQPGASTSCVLFDTSRTVMSAVSATGVAWPTDAVPVRVTAPGGSTAPSDGAAMVTARPVPPGRLPLAATAGARTPGGKPRNGPVRSATTVTTTALLARTAHPLAPRTPRATILGMVPGTWTSLAERPFG